MPIKNRHAVFSLGTVSGTDATPEADLSSMDKCMVFISAASGVNPVFEFQSSPGEFGSSATWGRCGTLTQSMMQATKIVVPMQWLNPTSSGGTISYGSPWARSPSRFRVKLNSGADITVHVEGLREIA